MAEPKTVKVLDTQVAGCHLEIILDLERKRKGNPLPVIVYRKGVRYVKGIYDDDPEYLAPVPYRRKSAEFSCYVDALEYITRYFKSGAYQYEE